MSKIAFLSCFYNPADFVRPVKNCIDYMNYTVDKAFDSKDFYFCQVISKYCKRVPKNEIKGNYLELESESVLWHKERCLNLLARKFDLYNKYDWICWVDADVIIEKPLKVDETKMVCQPFSTSLRAKKVCDLEKAFSAESYKFASYVSNPMGDKGLSWAIRSDLLKKIGGWFDYGIVGGGDSYFIKKMTGQGCSIGTKSFDALLADYFKGNYLNDSEIGFTSNTIFHMFHGNLTNRQYSERLEILRRYNFCPLDDMIVETSGLYRLKNKTFQEEIKKFFIDREEDC